MNNPYTVEQRKYSKRLEEHYQQIACGLCMATVTRSGETRAANCDGPFGNRHAISRSHLRLIADGDSKIRANKEYRSFTVWSEQHDALQPVAISQFSAGKWSCQRHDDRFGGIDAKQIDLSNPENLFKAVFRVVLRQSHLMYARWHAHIKSTKTDEGWERFKETAFHAPVSEETALEAAGEWEDEFRAVMRTKWDFDERLGKEDWDSLDCRALLLESEPTVAGWGCMMMKFDLRSLDASDPRQARAQHIELGYVIVIPQEHGHAIITACEPNTRLRVPEIVKIHEDMPERADPNVPYWAGEDLRRRLSSKVWGLNELGMKESLHGNWSQMERAKAQDWMKDRGRLPLSSQAKLIRDLPSFF